MNQDRPYQTKHSISINLGDLDVGTAFYVLNGCWFGMIVEHEGKKHVNTGIEILCIEGNGQPTENHEIEICDGNYNRPDDDIYSDDCEPEIPF